MPCQFQLITHIVINNLRNLLTPLTEQYQIQHLRDCQSHMAAQRVCRAEWKGRQKQIEILMIASAIALSFVQLTLAVEHSKAQRDCRNVSDTNDLNPERKSSRCRLIKRHCSCIRIHMLVKFIHQNPFCTC